METLSHVFNLQEQICYVRCSFCTTILLVSVPISSLSSVVTVKCGHCTGLLSVNMLKAFSLPFNLFAALNQNQNQNQEQNQLVPQETQGGALQTMDMWSTTVASSDHDQDVVEEEEEEIEDDDDDDDNDDDDDDFSMSDHIVHKPPEKKKRAPSAYNCFIKEEIRRLKALNPFMTHKEAFSTAAKNWARYPNSMRREENDDDEKTLLKKVDTENSDHRLAVTNQSVPI